MGGTGEGERSLELLWRERESPLSPNTEPMPRLEMPVLALEAAAGRMLLLHSRDEGKLDEGGSRLVG